MLIYCYACFAFLLLFNGVLFAWYFNIIARSAFFVCLCLLVSFALFAFALLALCFVASCFALVLSCLCFVRLFSVCFCCVCYAIKCAPCSVNAGRQKQHHGQSIQRAGKGNASAVLVLLCLIAFAIGAYCFIMRGLCLQGTTPQPPGGYFFGTD